ncbi:MAG TPA: molybdopterin-dependent oxidoreductase [bacterium]
MQRSLPARRLSPLVVLLFGAALLLAQGASALAADPAYQLTVSGNAVTPTVLTAEQLKAFPRQTLTVKNPHNGNTETYEGVWLLDVLKRVGAPVGDKLRGKTMPTVVIAEAGDGYRVAFALAELDPGTGDTQVLLADRMNGAALDKDSGPLRLVVPKDKRPARWIRQLSGLRVSISE